jgi:hypothetical protein
MEHSSRNQEKLSWIHENILVFYKNSRTQTWEKVGQLGTDKNTCSSIMSEQYTFFLFTPEFVYFL